MVDGKFWHGHLPFDTAEELNAHLDQVRATNVTLKRPNCGIYSSQAPERTLIVNRIGALRETILVDQYCIHVLHCPQCTGRQLADRYIELSGLVGRWPLEAGRAKYHEVWRELSSLGQKAWGYPPEIVALAHNIVNKSKDNKLITINVQGSTMYGVTRLYEADRKCNLTLGCAGTKLAELRRFKAHPPELWWTCRTCKTETQARISQAIWSTPPSAVTNKPPEGPQFNPPPEGPAPLEPVAAGDEETAEITVPLS